MNIAQENKKITSYYEGELQKAVAITFVDCNLSLDENMDSDFWQNIPAIDDFHPFNSSKMDTGNITFKLFRNREFLYVAMKYDKKSSINARNTKGKSPWNGDLIELFFSSMTPFGGLTQIAIGAGGACFSTGVDDKSWDKKIRLCENSWQVSFKISLQELSINNLATLFNLCYTSFDEKEYVIWSPVAKMFHEPENFGILLFSDYQTAASTLFNDFSNNVTTQNQFELMLKKNSVSAHEIKLQPYLSNPSPYGMRISWETYGKSSSVLLLKEHDSDQWQEVPSNRKGGILKANDSFHFVNLENLKPNTQYEYKVICYSQVLRKECHSELFTFTTFPIESDSFQFSVVSDIHGDFKMLENLLTYQEVAESKFIVNLGDYNSSQTSHANFISSFLATETKMFASNKPMVNVRGNHEQMGMFSASFFDYCGNAGNKSYYSFSYGNVFFMVLDAGNDAPDIEGNNFYNNKEFIEEQRLWLIELAKSSEFKNANFRIILNHMPVYQKDTYESKAVYHMLKDILNLEYKIHLMICGHLHDLMCTPPNSTKAITLSPQFDNDEMLEMPFAIIANGAELSTNAITTIKITEEKIFGTVKNGEDRDIFNFSIEKNVKFNQKKDLK